MRAMQAPDIQLDSTTKQRWKSQHHLSNWLTAFCTYFPRRAYLAERVAARLCGSNKFEDLISSTPTQDMATLPEESSDRLFARRRLEQFTEDRLTLVTEFGILPDAADQFLTLCPVGCGDCILPEKFGYFDENLTYYQDDQVPSVELPAILAKQYQAARGQLLSEVDTTHRLGNYLHPKLTGCLFDFLNWKTTSDLEGVDAVDASVPMTRIGWAADHDLGDVEVFTLRFTANPVWHRDELFWAVLQQLAQTRDLRRKPVLVLNNSPMQLIRDGHTFTSIGWMVVESKVMPLLINNRRQGIGAILIEMVTFDPATSTSLNDEGNAALTLFWGLLRQTSGSGLPTSPSFQSMPDNWMIPNVTPTNSVESKPEEQL